MSVCLPLHWIQPHFNVPSAACACLQSELAAGTGSQLGALGHDSVGCQHRAGKVLRKGAVAVCQLGVAYSSIDVVPVGA